MKIKVYVRATGVDFCCDPDFEGSEPVRVSDKIFGGKFCDSIIRTKNNLPNDTKFEYHHI
jgi:hypothetical protein